MNVDEINMSGQFSPPHETENTMMNEGDAEAEADSPYADQIASSSGMLLDEMGQSPKYEIDDFATKAEAYNIDLFQGEGEEKKVDVGKSGADAEMKEDGKRSSKKSKKSPKKDAGDDGEEGSGSSSSDSEGSSSGSQGGAAAETQAQHIEVPASVITRFFGKKESLTNYLANINQETTFTMLDDLCATYKYEDANREELTEFCYILFESLKASLVCQDLIKLLSKWQSLP